MELVTRNHWWPGVIKDVEKYVDSCDICQRMKNRIEVLVGKLKLSKIPEKPWTCLIVDFITKLPLVAGKDAILVVLRLKKVNLVSFHFFFIFIFFVNLFFIFSIFRTPGLGLEVISHISHIWWCVHNIDHGT